MMFDWKRLDRGDLVRLATVAGGAVVVVVVAYLVILSNVFSSTQKLAAPTPARAATAETQPKSGDVLSADSVNIEGDELKTIKVEEVGLRIFSVTQEAVGYIDFNQDDSLQVFTPYPGRILKLAAVAGDDVKKGQLLFTINSPDLVNAESSLISAKSTLVLNDKALKRAKELYASQALAQKDYEAAVNAYEMADGSYRAARDAVRIFGKSDAEIDQIAESRHVDGSMPVYSPIDSRVTARNAAIGLYVQPGNTPAPFTVADMSK
ncbi:MAG: efflux RND transporter periplasmic adaptor subunit, partial [Alphaproteobacteria bacterium]|nr:efflux RND transporter periplasmic adaptor subunit [Alphaproteobacteria bacterium]